MEKQPIIQVKNIKKSFGATQALRGVSFDFYPGEIIGLEGANGAGKSTLIKIICGYYTDYEGDIIIHNRKVVFNSPKDAYERGIITVHQNINQGVIQEMTVAENLALEHLLTRTDDFFYNKKVIRAKAKDIAEKMQLEFDLDKEVRELSQSDRQLITIARGLAANPKLFILDEPTSSLSEKEAERLLKILLNIKQHDVSVIYISHKLQEVKEVCDKVGVIRDGLKVGLYEKPFNMATIVDAMIGEGGTSFIKEGKAKNEEVALEVKNLVVDEGKPALNFKIYKGEVFGLTGLIGSGKTELAEIIFGMRQPVSGEIYIEGKPVKFCCIKDAVEAGVYLVPEDRNNNAIFSENTIMYNMDLPFLKYFCKLGLMQKSKEKKEVDNIINLLEIKCENECAMIESLSGGNQQKVVVGRWLLKEKKILILDEPFQGVDIKSRHDIIKFLRKNNNNGAIIFISTDFNEVIEMADRIAVLNNGDMVGVKDGANMTREEVLQLVSL
jgi:simple sugar transport system ATP-binding protein